MWVETMRSIREDTVTQRRKTPSFSSSLLDAIYRSIDDEFNGKFDEFCSYKETKTTIAQKQSNDSTEDNERYVSGRSHQKEIKIEKLNQKQRVKASQLFNSSSNSSDSSSRDGTFSSSESESNHRPRSLSRPSCFAPLRSKPFQTRASVRLDDQISSHLNKSKQQQLQRHPISPGRRITTFLNSLFNANKETCTAHKKFSKSTTTTCSLASSLSKSCLTKIPSSTRKSSIPEAERSGKNIENNRISRREIKCFDQFDDEQDDVESDASSDLFEIENLFGIGEKYGQELPVYGTTDLKINQAFASGVFV